MRLEIDPRLKTWGGFGIGALGIIDGVRRGSPWEFFVGTYLAITFVDRPIEDVNLLKEKVAPSISYIRGFKRNLPWILGGTAAAIGLISYFTIR